MASLSEAKEVETSPNDKRTYRGIELSNGLKALVIHDADADIAAAAMNVRFDLLEQ